MNDETARIVRRGWIVLALLALVVLAALRSWWATRLDGMTIDEPYHITSGVSYVRTGDYRLNPEHPPLVKLWVGAALPPDAFRLPPFRALSDKPDERRFTQTAVFRDNDPDRVHRRARIAMLVLNGLFLLLFGLVAWRALGPGIAVGAVAFLAVDPTVAAHLPVVMTDLPVALLSATAVLLAVAAFRSWSRRDLAAASLALGAVLGAKHSGLVTALAVAALGLGCALRGSPDRGARLRRTAAVAAVLLGALAVLWALYGFHFHANAQGEDLFNRTLGEKIADLRTPFFRDALALAERTRVLPAAYLWGLADVLRAGLEGRGSGMFAFGRWHPLEAPWYFFPGVIALKLPLGLGLLALLGLLAALRDRRAVPARLPLRVMGALALLFLVFLGTGSAYAGVRHALPVFPALALLGGVALAAAVRPGSRGLRLLAALALLGATASALPVVRPWEYYNEILGGAENGYLYFSDEGIDLGQRSLELAGYYHRELRPRKELPFIDYWLMEEEEKRRGIRSVSWESPGGASDVVRGTILIQATRLAPHPRFDLAAFREARPVARMGNLLVFRGSFHIPWRRSMGLYGEAMKSLYLEKKPARAEALLAEAVRLYPRHYAAAIELGNLRARRGLRAEAIAAFKLARAQSTPGDPIIERLTEQIERLAQEPPAAVPPVRNPWAE